MHCIEVVACGELDPINFASPSQVIERSATACGLKRTTLFILRSADRVDKVMCIDLSMGVTTL